MGIEPRYLPTVTGHHGLSNIPIQFQPSTLPVQRLRLKQQVKPRRDARDALCKQLGLSYSFGRKKK
jgi:hypothetical protein